MPESFTFRLQKTPQEYFFPFLGEPFAAIFETTLRRRGAGARSIIAVRPRYWVTGGLRQTRVRDLIRGKFRHISGDFFKGLKHFLDRRKALGRHPTLLGAGFFGYELNRALEKLPPAQGPAPGTPGGFFFFTGTFVVLDHAQKRGRAVAPTARELRWLKETLATAGIPENLPSISITGLRADGSRARYLARVDGIKRFIAAGDIYQANLTQEFVGDVRGGGRAYFNFYRHLTRVSPAEFSAFLKFRRTLIVSASPERFLKISPGGRMESRPIKGTLPRAGGPARDARARAALRKSPKDRAENLMIVDLVRNDLGRVAVPGSVRVKRLFAVETFSTLFHLVSAVTARLRPDRHPMDAVAACFPPGSMTGAPKIRAMEILNRLEGRRRGIYSGALGLIDNRGAVDLSVVIRTAVVEGGRLRFATGGAVVADSRAALEYRESLHKAAGILKALSLASGRPVRLP